MPLAAKGKGLLASRPHGIGLCPWGLCLPGRQQRTEQSRPGGGAPPLAGAWHPAAARGEDAGGLGEAAALPRYLLGDRRRGAGGGAREAAGAGGSQRGDR